MKIKLPWTLLVSLPFLGCRARSLSEGGQAPAEGANRLIHETSPYLLAHAHNPVDWYPWGEEALETARKENKPIFLSVGYSTCYWCHVMEREIFSNAEIAEKMNAWFVNIKVDREERPDLDDIYMMATEILRGSGGWPNSVFLTPDLKPFFAGSTFPPQDRNGRPGFPTVLERIHEAWVNQRKDVVQSAEQVAEAMHAALAEGADSKKEIPPSSAADRVAALLSATYDKTYGGFGAAPKFPSPASLTFLWGRAERGDLEARRMVVGSLLKMGEGAIYDQIGGGFHRYTLDERWRIPHFEKMLYDNALLAELLAVAARSTGDRELERLARQTLEFALQEMQLAEGGFKSAIDAETNGKEGATYIWTRGELLQALGKEGFDRLAPIFGFDGPPNLDEAHTTLYLSAPFEEQARRAGMTREELLATIEPYLARLREVRTKREQPLVDDKVLTDWNGMMMSAMARAGAIFHEPRYIEAAKKAAAFLLREARAPDETLLHVWRRGEAKIPAFLDDYAFLIRGLLSLYEVTDAEPWLEAARELADQMEVRLRDPEGGYYLSASRPHLPFQPKSVMDGAIPSGNATMILNLLSLAEHTGEDGYRRRAEAALGAFAFALQRYPTGARTLALALEQYHQGHTRVLANATSPAGSFSALEQLARDVTQLSMVLDRPSSSDGWWAFELRVAIREGWHINANPASLDELVPTEIKGQTRKLHYPPGRPLRFAFAEAPLSVYTGSVVIKGEVSPEARSLTLVYQPCDDMRCLAPVEKRLRLAKTP